MVNCDFKENCSSRGYKCNTCARSQKEDYYVPRPWYNPPWNPWHRPYPRRKYRYTGTTTNDNTGDYYISA